MPEKIDGEFESIKEDIPIIETLKEEQITITHNCKR